MAALRIRCGCTSQNTSRAEALMTQRLVHSLCASCGWLGDRGMVTPTRAPPVLFFNYLSSWLAYISRLSHGQDICGCSRYHIHISESRKEEEGKECHSLPFCFHEAAFLKAPPPCHFTPTYTFHLAQPLPELRWPHPAGERVVNVVFPVEHP